MNNTQMEYIQLLTEKILKLETDVTEMKMKHADIDVQLIRLGFIIADLREGIK